MLRVILHKTKSMSPFLIDILHKGVSTIVGSTFAGIRKVAVLHTYMFRAINLIGRKHVNPWTYIQIMNRRMFYMERRKKIKLASRIS